MHLDVKNNSLHNSQAKFKSNQNECLYQEKVNPGSFYFLQMTRMGGKAV